MNVLRHTDNSFVDKLRGLTTHSSLFDPTVEERTRVILQEVYTRGDAAVVELTERFDGDHLTARQLPVTRAELMGASLQADESLRKAVEITRNNLEMFSRKSLRKAWSA